MGTRNVENGYTDTLDGVIVALCKDFDRRADTVKEGRCSRRTAMEYEYINRRLLDAVRELAGDDALIYIREIGGRLGFAYSDIDGASESTYKKLKKEIKLNIAKKLHMID